MLILDNLDPSKTALLIIDAHAPFISQKDPAMSKMAEAIKHFADFSRYSGIKPNWIVKVDRNAPFDNSMLTAAFLKPHMEQVEPDFEKDVFHYKRSYSAFSYTDLKIKLQNQGVSQLLIAGCYTQDCVYHTIIDAAAEGFEVALLWDLTDEKYNPYSKGLKAKFLGERGIIKLATILHSDDVRAELSGCMYRNTRSLQWNDINPELV